MAEQDSEEECRARVEALMVGILNVLRLPTVSIDDAQHALANVVSFIALRTDNPGLVIESTISAIRDVYTLQPARTKNFDPESSN